MTDTVAAKRRVFLALHHRANAFVIPNAWDAGSARILAALGFEALATTSAGLAFALGRKDGVAALSREETLENARQIVDAAGLPVSADLEDGFGKSPEACAETIRLAAEAGLAGGSIEDATGDASNPLFDFTLALERIAASAEAAHKTGFVLTARSENFRLGRPDLDDTIRRLQAFSKAGADVLYAPGLRDLGAIRTLCAAVDKPVNVLAGLSGITFAVDDLTAAGVKRISVGGSFARAALGAFVSAAREVKDKGTFGFATSAIPANAVEAMMGSEKTR